MCQVGSVFTTDLISTVVASQIGDNCHLNKVLCHDLRQLVVLVDLPVFALLCFYLYGSYILIYLYYRNI